jgi:hypothetical protein
MLGGPPRDFCCPDCGALYKLVRVPKSERDRLDYEPILCVHCSRLLTPKDNGFFLKYFMIRRPEGRKQA